MNITDVMTRSVECLRPSDSIAHAAERMRDLEVGSLPVCGNDDRLAGIITDRDITIRATAGGCDTQITLVEAVMTPGIVYCFDDQTVEDAAKLMEDKQIRRLVVLNRDKRLVGIVSLGDLATETGDRQKTGAVLQDVSEPSKPRR